MRPFSYEVNGHIVRDDSTTQTIVRFLKQNLGKTIQEVIYLKFFV